MGRTVIIEEDKYKVDIDNYNHTLYKYNPGGYEVRKPGTKEFTTKEPSWEFVGFYPNMKQVLSQCVDEELSTGEDTTLQGYLKELNATIKDLHGRITL